MTRQRSLRHEYVEYIPKHLEEGCLYICKRFKTASHLCCCGCGHKVVTPLNPTKWKLTDHGSSVSLNPSIGNWSFSCRSHYFINHGQIIWASKMSATQIRRVQQKDFGDSIRPSIRNTTIERFSYLLKRLFGDN